ncbi:hypothetical protein Rhe02_65430 [Rhizocola hellebori]|uniref:Uncharacterized protein n=1 Tax=Rhizocola hellebori TaxID=1392758 RepID=A0A8J3QD55_9ACTN|nr:hypothetical protein [Rhizocola hellebori]GIH08476.1 hypothetical protein Rhe02_65430 [Rhizocola hellebori]
MKRQIMALGAAILTSVALTFVPATAANAAGPEAPQTATPGGHHGWDVCTTLRSPIPNQSTGYRDTVDACFEKQGDVFTMLDIARISWGDPGNAWIQWTNELKDSGGTWRYYRSGECWLSGTMTEGHCDKNFYENTTSPNAKGGVGSRLIFKACHSFYGCSSPVYATNDE